ncbi:MAG: DivIVA domain-containing protein [Propionibacteriaceae bacterium]|nr:DivIVA domain-containing protein [Propionibacteriaceae bacterium]
MTLTLDEVRKTKFHMARRTGYEVSEVDLFVDRVEASFAQLLEENQMLKQQVEALKQAQARQRVEREEPVTQETRRPEPPTPAPAAPAPAPTPVATAPQPLARPAQPGGTEKIVVTTSAEASPAVVRLVQLATEQSEQLVNEATSEAKRKVDEANQKANQITTAARTKSERLEAEARTNAERVTNEAQGRAADLDRQVGLRRSELFAELEQERDQLQDAVGQLRSFEANYRQSFSSHLKQQLQSVESISFEPSNKPTIADRNANVDGRRARQGGDTGGQQNSNTPRLDALLGENQRNN